ncbi:MAG: peptide-binding protein [Sedimentisphaerales bacterium]
MNRKNAGGFLLFLFLALVICLQVFSMIQSDRLYIALNKIEAAIEHGRSAPKFARGAGEKDASIRQYQGDEGDWLVWAMRVEPKTMNQINVDSDIYSRWITFKNIFEPLMVYDFDEVKLKPNLAESYEISGDGLEITFRLRDDAHFSDGVPVTADDVIFTYNTIMDPNVDAATIASLYIDVDKVEKISDRVVRFFMKRPYFKALEVCSFWDIGIYPKHIYQYKDAHWFNQQVTNPVGSGLYIFERWESGKQIVLHRNENYWGARPKIRKVVYKFITNPIAAIQALKAHQVDLVVIHDPGQFADLVADKQFNKEFKCMPYWAMGDPFYFIGWNEDTPFFSDVRVRQAMTMAIDRELIASKLLKGYGEIVTGPYFIKSTQYDPNIKPWPYDPQRARQLLEQAGWVDSDGDGIREKNGVVFRFKFLYAAGDSLYTPLSTLLKDELAEIGVEVIPDPIEWSVLLPKLSDRQFESMAMGWGGDIVEDNYQILHSSQVGHSGANYVGFRNAEVDSLLEEVRRTLDSGKRDILCHRIHKIVHEQQPFTFLYSRPIFRAVDKRFKNVKIHKLGLNYLEWYVPKDEQRYK